MKLERLSVKYGRRKNISSRAPLLVRIFSFLSFPYRTTCFFKVGINLLLTLGLWAGIAQSV